MLSLIDCDLLELLSFYGRLSFIVSVFCVLPVSGSKLENWHSILRNGLVVASGTDFELNGAVYGKGIYLSAKASLAFSYLTKVKPSLPAGQLVSGCSC